ncbi:MAG: CGNR zinc finger domain-containing protein [Actinobacteria bacterium]|nr:CGNR zinc finger domain-containing protein [Actinomycetota bacterium]
MNLSSYAELAVRLANTAAQADGEPDPLSSPAACAGALGDCLEGPVTRRDLDVLRNVRQELQAIFRAAATGADVEAMTRLNALLVQFPIQPEMTSHDDQRWHVHLASQGAIGDRFAAAAIISVALTVSLVGVSRLGLCAIATCPQVFIDASPSRSRRYCAEHAATRGNVSTLRRKPADLTQPAAGLARSATSAAS